MTFTSTSRADWQTQAHSAGTRRSPGWTLADEREARTAREEEMTTAAHPQTARRRPGAQESQGSPGKPRTTRRGVLGTLPSRRDTPPPGPGSVSRRRGPVSLSSQGSRQGWRSPFWTPGWREARADAGTFLVVAFHKGSCYKVLSPLELENVSLPDSVTTPPGRIRAAGSSPARWYSGGVPPSTTRLPRSRPPPPHEQVEVAAPGPTAPPCCGARSGHMTWRRPAGRLAWDVSLS